MSRVAPPRLFLLPFLVLVSRLCDYLILICSLKSASHQRKCLVLGLPSYPCFSQPWCQHENGNKQVIGEGRTWCETEAWLGHVSPLSAQRTPEALLPPLYLLPKLRLMKKWAILGQFSMAKTGRGGVMCSEEELMVSERPREGRREPEQATAYSGSGG